MAKIKNPHKGYLDDPVVVQAPKENPVYKEIILKRKTKKIIAKKPAKSLFKRGRT